MKKSYLKVLNISFTLCVLFVAFVEGFINPFILWNILPIVIGYFLIRRVIKKTTSKISDFLAALGFSLPSTGFIIFCHIAWLFNWDNIATGSSTSGLIFIFIPIYALAGGIIGFFVGFLGKKIYFRLKPKNR